MSDNIRDDELDFGLAAETSAQRDSISAGPVRGTAALKGLYAKGNRKRLYAYVAVGILLLSALIYTFVGAENPVERGQVGVVQAGVVSGREQSKRSMIDNEEAVRYNTEQLELEQQDNPYAHPIITTDEDDYSPFEEKSNLKTPGRLSESGSTETNGGQQGRATTEYYDEAAVQNANTLVMSLIDEEAVSPVLNKVSWSYAKPKAKAAVPDGLNDDRDLSADNTSSTKSCAIPGVRAGTRVMATADMAVNSDVGGPISLTIRNGRLRGSQLIGSFERKEEWLRLELSTLVGPDETISTSAIGLDLGTTLNAVSGKVDRHTLYRYGWWGVGTTLSAIGKAATANTNTTSYVSDGVVTESSSKDTAREIKMAVGSLGEELGEVMRERINRPITVSLKVDDEVGVFFLEDVCLESKN